MSRLLLNAVLVLFGGMIAAKLVELFLTSEQGERLTKRAGLTDLTTYRGVEMAQKYTRTIVGIVAGAAVAILEIAVARSDAERRPGWPERVQAYAQILLALGSVARAVSDFLGERRRLFGEPTATA